MKAIGYALHYFDAGLNSDKYYRIYLFTKGSGLNMQFHVVSHWGRDGSINGQSKAMSFDTWADAKNYASKLGDSKIKKGYEFLGEQEVEFNLNDLYTTGQRLMKATGRTPTKVNGFGLIIQEEADLIDLLMA